MGLILLIREKRLPGELKTHWKLWFFIAVAFALMFTFINLELPNSVRFVGDIELTRAGQTAIAILLFALVLWVTEAIPFHITGMVALLFLALFGVGDFQDVISAGFGNDIVVFFIGVLVLSVFITQSGLGKRISVFVLAKTGNSTSAILLGFLVAGTLLSMWVTDMAAAAILMPLARSILREEGLIPRKSNFGKALMIACAWGPLIGGIATPAGCGANPVAMQFLREIGGIHLSFLDWMAFGVPAALLLIIPSWMVLRWFFPFEIKQLKKTKEELQKEYRHFPPFNREERITLGIFLLTVLFWLLSPMLEEAGIVSIPISMTVLFTFPLFFLPGMTKKTWKDVEKDVDWSGILLIVTGISLGLYLYRSGAASWLAFMLLGRIGAIPLFTQLFVITLAVSLLKVVFSSNTVTATIIVPLVITLGQTMNLNVLGITLAAGMTSSLAFILVTTTPTNVIPYTAGYFTIKDMAKAGLALTLVASLTIALVFWVVGNMTGMF